LGGTAADRTFGQRALTNCYFGFQSFGFSLCVVTVESSIVERPPL
jgi:hypothetical protein